MPADTDSYDDYSSDAYRARGVLNDGYGRHSRPSPPDYFSRAGKRRAIDHRDPIWGFVLPPIRPTDRGDRFFRPFRVHNDSRWSEAFSSSPLPVVEDARTIYNACAWVQTVHNRLLDAELNRLDGELTARELLNEVIYTRASLHQLFLILVTRYRVLSEQSTNPTLAANLQDLLLAPDDAESIYCPTMSFFQSSVLAHRTFAVSREQADRVQARLRPRRLAPAASPGSPAPSASARRRQRARRNGAPLAPNPRQPQGYPGGGGNGGGGGSGGGAHGQGGGRGGNPRAAGIGGGGAGGGIGGGGNGGGGGGNRRHPGGGGGGGGAAGSAGGAAAPPAAA